MLRCRNYQVGMAAGWVAMAISVRAGEAALPADTGSVEAGQAVYQQHCSACHGPQGDGSGPASVWLFPRPRNFSAGLFKIKSTPGTALPTDEDLFRTITRGMPGTRCQASRI